MPFAVDAQAIARLEGCLEFLRTRGPAIAHRFYSALFGAHPSLRAMFPKDMASQEKKLLDSLVLVIQHLKDSAKIRVALRELGARHAAYGAKPEHYPIVCKLLVDAMAAEMGSQWSTQLANEWSLSLELISKAMIDASESVSHG